MKFVRDFEGRRPVLTMSASLRATRILRRSSNAMSDLRSRSRRRPETRIEGGRRPMRAEALHLIEAALDLRAGAERDESVTHAWPT